MGTFVSIRCLASATRGEDDDETTPREYASFAFFDHSDRAGDGAFLTTGVAVRGVVNPWNRTTLRLRPFDVTGVALLRSLPTLGVASPSTIEYGADVVAFAEFGRLRALPLRLTRGGVINPLDDFDNENK